MKRKKKEQKGKKVSPVYVILGLIVLSTAINVFMCPGTDDTAIPVVETEQGGSSWLVNPGDEPVEPADVNTRNYYIIFDGSGSMSGQKIVTAKKALKSFITRIPKGANVGLTAFDINGNFERASFGASREQLLVAVDKMSAGGATPLGESCEIAYGRLNRQALAQRGYGEYSLVIITDGEATDGPRLKEAIDLILRDSPVTIHTIGFQIGPGHVLNQPGKIYYKTAQDIQELSRGLEEVLAELEDFTVSKF